MPGQWYTRCLLWFLKTDAAVPEPVRREMARWAWCGDEWADNGHFPTQLYVREGRRMVGAKVITWHDATNASRARGAGLAVVAVADYAFDCHPVEIVPEAVAPPGGGGGAAAVRATVEGCLESDAAHVYPGPARGGWQIPYAALTPKRSQLGNLLVPVALSASHVAFSSIRLELTWMALGQSAGTVRRATPLAQPCVYLAATVAAQRSASHAAAGRLSRRVLRRRR